MNILFKSPTRLATTLAGLIISGSALALPAVNIVDTYQGSDSHGYGDRIGGSTFEVHSMDVELNGTVLDVRINTSYAGHTGLYGTGYGDLFLASKWTPFGNGPEYLLDDATTGTKWSYGFSIDGDVFNSDGSIDKNLSTRYNNHSGGSGTLYELAGGANDSNVLTSDDVINPNYIFRNGQEVIVDTRSQSPVVDTGISGSWSIHTGNGDDFISFSIDLAGTSLLLGDEIALHWGMTCGNDTIEGAYDISGGGGNPVPAPGILLLMLSGLAGMRLARAGRRQRHG